MLRFTLQDSEKRITYVDRAELAPYMVAACATEPTSIEELLLAVEAYSPGMTARIMQGLLEYDAGLLTGVEADTAASSWYFKQPVLEVVNELSDLVALTPEAEGLVAIDLVSHEIIGRGSAKLLPRGAVTIPGARNRQQVAYVLSDSWTVSINTGAPNRRRASGASHV